MNRNQNVLVTNPDWQIAQINIARLIAAEGDARVQPFFDALDRVNALADNAPGFIWRLKDEAYNGAATFKAPFPEPGNAELPDQLRLGAAA